MLQSALEIASCQNEAVPVMKGDMAVKYVIRFFQVSTLLGGAEFMIMLLFGDLIESVKPVVLGAVLASLTISGVLGIIERKLTGKRDKALGI